MKALLDTNIIIHRESPHVKNLSIGILFSWLDKVRYEKCIQVTGDRHLSHTKSEEILGDTFSVFGIPFEKIEK